MATVDSVCKIPEERTGVATDPEKVAAVEEWPKPQGVKQLQAFLGTVGYYGQYIPRFATIAQPLHRLTSKEVEWSWGRQSKTPSSYCNRS